MTVVRVEKGVVVRHEKLDDMDLDHAFFRRWLLGLINPIDEDKLLYGDPDAPKQDWEKEA